MMHKTGNHYFCTIEMIISNLRTINVTIEQSEVFILDRKIPVCHLRA